VHRLRVGVARVVEEQRRGLRPLAAALGRCGEGLPHGPGIAVQEEVEIRGSDPAQLAQHLGHALGVGAGVAQLHLPWSADVVAGHDGDAPAGKGHRAWRDEERHDQGDGAQRAAVTSGPG